MHVLPLHVPPSFTVNAISDVSPGSFVGSGVSVAGVGVAVGAASTVKVVVVQSWKLPPTPSQATIW